jgi:sulfur-oxidizing protein SoxY
MDIERRRVLKGTGTAGMLAAAFAAGILKPSALLAAWNQRAFDAKSLADALGASGLSGSAQSRDIVIDAPEFAENGAFVPVQITSNIAGTGAIAIFIDKNPYPYIARFDLSGGAQPFVALRVRVAESSPLRVLVAAGGKHYSATKDVKVTAGGCGDGGAAEAPRPSEKPEPMKIRARLEGDAADIRVLMPHPMENGLRMTASGQAIPEHFIQGVSVQLNGRTVLEAEIGRSVSTNPVFGFRVKGAKADDKLTLSWKDNRGLARTDEARVAVG